MRSIVHVAIAVQFSENEISHWQKIRLIGTSANVYTTLCNSKCARNQTLAYSIFTWNRKRSVSLLLLLLLLFVRIFSLRFSLFLSRLIKHIRMERARMWLICIGWTNLQSRDTRSHRVINDTCWISILEFNSIRDLIVPCIHTRAAHIATHWHRKCDANESNKHEMMRFAQNPCEQNARISTSTLEWNIEKMYNVYQTFEIKIVCVLKMRRKAYTDTHA